MTTSITKRVVAVLMNDPKRIHTYGALAERFQCPESTVRSGVHRIPKALLKFYKTDGKTGISINESNMELAAMFMDEKYPPKKKALEVGSGHLTYDQHAIQFSMPIVHIEEKGRVTYYKDVTNNATRYRYAKVKTPWLVDYPNLELTICNVNSRTLRVWVPRIRFKLNHPDEAKHHDRFVRELLAKLRRYLEYLGFGLGEMNVPEPHYAFPMEEYAELLKGRALKVSDVEWLDYTPEEYDSQGRPTPIRETPSKELRDKWLAEDKKKLEQSDKLDYLLEWVEVCEPINMREREHLEGKIDTVMDVVSKGQLTTNNMFVYLVEMYGKQRWGIETLTEITKVPREDEE